MKVSLFYLPSVGSRSEIERGMVALRGDLYDRMLREITEQAQLADALGYDSISFTEHHLHAEGFEVSNNPVMLDLYIAMLDHMTGGRANAGVARGYQRRWVDIMAQQTHGIHGAQPHQHDAIDDV